MSAPFRIVKRRTRGPSDDFKEYLDRLLRMIPAEVVGLYIIGNGFIPADQAVASAIWFLLCLALVVVVRIFGTADGPKQPWQKFPVIVSTIAFVIWVYAQGGPFAKFNWHVPFVGSLAVLVWSFIIPIFYKGDPPPVVE